MTISREDLRTYQYDRTRYGFNGDIDYNVKPGWTVYLSGLLADFHDYGNVYVYAAIAGAIVSNSGAQTTFDNTGGMQYRQYVRRPDQGVFSIATGATHAVSTMVIHYQFAVSRGHNYGGQDFATTNFSGPSNVTVRPRREQPLPAETGAAR